MNILHQILINNIITLDNTFNTRTIGGFKTIDNFTVKENILFRSDGLHNLSNNDKKILENLDIKRIVDFRSNNEINKHPDILWNNVNYIHMPISADKKIMEDLPKILNNTLKKDIKEYLINENKNFILSYTNLYSRFIKDFINSNGEKTIFHCTAGKDRTGFASILILSIIGVEQQTIINEYMFSNYCIEKTFDQQLIKVSEMLNISKEDIHKIIPLLKVNIEYINSALDTINEYYGNMNIYIKQGLLLSDNQIEKLKSILLF